MPEGCHEGGEGLQSDGDVKREEGRERRKMDRFTGGMGESQSENGRMIKETRGADCRGE